MIRGWCRAVTQGIRLTVQVMPNARKTEVVGVFDDTLKIRLHAQPIEGKANDALIRYLADVIDVSKSVVTITHGHTGKRKIVEIHARHLDADKVMGVLLSSRSAAGNGGSET